MCLVDQWDTTKNIYMKMKTEHKNRFEQLTEIDDLAFEDDNEATAQTTIDSLVDDEAAAQLYKDLLQLRSEAVAAGPKEEEEKKSP